MCLEIVGEDNILDLFCKFHDLKTKNEQDIFLQGLIDVEQVKTRRPRTENPRRNKAVYQYHLMIGSERRKVCLEAYCNSFGVTEKKVRRIRELKQKGKTPEDKRGKNISFTLSQETKALVREHISSFPVKESHYTGQKKLYLSADLNIKIMHNLYIEKNPNNKVSYTFYQTFFKENFSLRFGRPQVDTCITCEQLNLKIKSPHLNEAAKRSAVAELMVHKRRSRKFYEALKHEASDDGKAEENVLSIAFDYMQNLCLPKVPVQDLFYLRQLTVNVFCITDIKVKSSSIYVYHEGEGRKSPDEVCSFLFDFLKNVPDNITELRIFSDNCPGQNKNQSLTRFMLFLTDSKRFQKIQSFFPVRGHSYLPCDRDFGLIKKVIRRMDRIFSIHEITELIIKSGKVGKFLVTQAQASNILDFKQWWPVFYKKTTISEETKRKPRKERVSFAISKFYHFVFSSECKGYIKAYTTINGLNCATFYFSAQPGQVTPPEKEAYPIGKVPIKENKLQDIKKLISYVPEEHKEFYNSILAWPVST